jgi:hypothetical protein
MLWSLNLVLTSIRYLVICIDLSQRLLLENTEFVMDDGMLFLEQDLHLINAQQHLLIWHHCQLVNLGRQPLLSCFDLTDLCLDV